VLGRLLLSLRVDGLRPTLQRIRAHVHGDERRYVFVQYYTPPAAPVQLPVETNGVVVRQMTDSDRRVPGVRRHEPEDMAHLALGVVATRQGEIVGAAWYTDAVRPQQPWYAAVQPHLRERSLVDANLFVVPGEKAAAWALSKNATDYLATQGVRSTVALVGVDNARSIFLMRLLGAKVVATMSVRYRFGRRRATVEPVRQDDDAAVTGSQRSS